MLLHTTGGLQRIIHSVKRIISCYLHSLEDLFVSKTLIWKGKIVTTLSILDTNSFSHSTLAGSYDPYGTITSHHQISFCTWPQQGWRLPLTVRLHTSICVTHVSTTFNTLLCHMSYSFIFHFFFSCGWNCQNMLTLAI